MVLSEQLAKLLIGKKDLFTDIVGQHTVKRDVRSALLSDRHVLIIGPPGIGKTTLAKNVARMIASTNDKETPFVRVQGSPDLTAEDLIGDIDPVKALEFGPLSTEAFTKGKIFKANNGVLFFDELNRCSEKLQNALLQVLAERKATIGSYDLDFDASFVFIATMNPEDTSTETLSDVLLDRFDVVYMDYPNTQEDEVLICETHAQKLVTFPKNVLDLTVQFIRELRNHDKLEKLPSVRATIGLYERAGANALLRGSTEASFADVATAVPSVLCHRIKLKPSAQYLQTTAAFVKKELERFANEHGMSLHESGDVP